MQAMEKMIRIYTSHEEMKAEDYRYWQSRPAYERLDAVSKMTLAACAMKGEPIDVPGLQGPLVVIQRPQR